MIRFILFVTVFLFASMAYGQELPSQGIQKSNIQVGLFYSLDTNLSDDRIALSHQTGYSIHYNQYNFTAGLTLQYFLTPKWALNSGLSYSNKSFEGTFYCITCSFIRAPQPEEIKLQFVQIPVTVRYYPYLNDIGFFGEVGLLNQFMLKKPGKSRLKGNTFSISSVIGAGMVYDFNNGVTAEVSVQYTNGLSKIFDRVGYAYRMLGFRLSLLKKW